MARRALVACQSQPTTVVDDALPWACALPVVHGAACPATCAEQFTGRPNATCNNGTYDTIGECLPQETQMRE